MDILGIGEELLNVPDQIATIVNALGALVASRSGLPVRWARPERLQLIKSYRSDSPANLKPWFHLHLDSCRECE